MQKTIYATISVDSKKQRCQSQLHDANGGQIRFTPPELHHCAVVMHIFSFISSTTSVGKCLPWSTSSAWATAVPIRRTTWYISITDSWSSKRGTIRILARTPKFTSKACRKAAPSKICSTLSSRAALFIRWVAGLCCFFECFLSTSNRVLG